MSKRPSNGFFRMLRQILAALALSLMLAGTSLATSLEEAAQRVARQHDAKVLSAQTIEQRDGRRVHVIRILTRDGVVRTIRVPADRGR